MDDNSFFDEGLVAAALGAPATLNPYEVGTVPRRVWRDGFISYGVAAEDTRVSGERQLEGAERS
jgi:hypothetical protein